MPLSIGCVVRLIYDRSVWRNGKHPTFAVFQALTFWDSKDKQKGKTTGYHEQAVWDTAAETEKGKRL